MKGSDVVILAAGRGTRMRSATPKVLHKACGQELVSHVAKTAARAGFDRTVVIIPPNSPMFSVVLGESVQCVEQAEPCGTGHALMQARPSLTDATNVAVLYGDLPLIHMQTLNAMARLHHESQAAITLLTANLVDTAGYGRVIRSSTGEIIKIVEETEADETTLAINEINGGAYIFRAPWIWDTLPQLAKSNNGEIFITDLIGHAQQQGLVIESLELHNHEEIIGVNTRIHLAEVEKVMRKRISEHWMLKGITIRDPSSVYIDMYVQIDVDTEILPNSHISGNTKLGSGCVIGPNTVISNSEIGDECRIVSSVIEHSTLEEQVNVGPYSHLRPGTYLSNNVSIGNFSEVKNSLLGPRTKSGHFSYIGDAEIGADVNSGAGTVTCNYDGYKKSRTTIGDGAFIGSDTMLIAPVQVGPHSSTGAGSIVTRDVPASSTATGSPARVFPKRNTHQSKNAD